MAVRLGALALALAGAVTVACSGIVDPSKNQIETFSGTIPLQGTDPNPKPFSTSKQGEYSIKVTSLDPPTGAFFGVILAIRSSGSICAPPIQSVGNNSFATVNTIALNSSIYPGSYCVYVYDIGSFTTAENYTLQVSHP